MSLKGKTAVVTGGSRGIGKAISMKLAKQGANIVVLDMVISDETIDEIKKLKVKAIGIETNVTDEVSVNEAIKKVLETFETIDIVVNNAGITKDNLLLRMKKEDWDAVINVNLTGAFNVLKAVNKPMFKQRSGKIINIASVVGLMGNVGQANYAASKAGLIGMTKTLAREFATRNIQVNAVAPGFINTEMTKKLSAEVVDYFIKNIPLGTFGEAEDVANAVAFLAGPDSNYITGQVVNVDGGMVM
ncbi:MAG: 3-oxoacyl-[acyl-carrier-protein] reductase [Candidatus Margulisbacteria bacterium GWF2_35_9]|nr:MAG: 3-oxoacyl-[acyl-carrier-protein] reductase [Candidatus Margulisbacteria bacterium GWF2_35_9]